LSQRDAVIAIDWHNIHVPFVHISAFVLALKNFALKQAGVVKVKNISVFFDINQIPAVKTAFEELEQEEITIVHKASDGRANIETIMEQHLVDEKKLRASDAIIVVSGDRGISGVLARFTQIGNEGLLIYHLQTWKTIKYNPQWSDKSNYLDLPELARLHEEIKAKQLKNQQKEAYRIAALEVSSSSSIASSSSASPYPLYSQYVASIPSSSSSSATHTTLHLFSKKNG